MKKQFKRFSLLIVFALIMASIPANVMADSVGDNVTEVINYLRAGNVSKAQSYNQQLPEYASESCVSEMTGAMKAAYKEEVESWEYAKQYGNYAFRDYWLTDIDNDGYAELLINLAPDSAGALTHIYKYQNGQLTELGEFSGNETCHAYPSHNGIVTEGGKMGYNWLSLITVENSELVKDQFILYGDGDLSTDQYFNMRNQLKSHSEWSGEKYVPDYDDLEDEGAVTTKTINFDSGIYKKSRGLSKISFSWGFDYFEPSSHIPNVDIAKASLILSANIYDWDLVESTLYDLGFDDIETGNDENNDYYDYYDDINRVGYAIASTVRNIDGKETNVIAVVCRGSTGVFLASADWQSNVLQQAQGFRYAAENVKEGLDDYIDDYDIDTSLPTKILITGHSRGAAAANILGTIVTDITSENNVFVYTFACPNTTTEDNRRTYANSYNFVVDGDPVPAIPFMFGGNNKFGKIITKYAQPNDSSFIKNFQLITGGVSTTVLDTSNDCVSSYNRIIRHHAPAVYMACLLTTGMADGNSSYTTRGFSARCPVDVFVYDSDNNLLGTIVDNTPDEDLILNGLFAVIDGDDKYIYTGLNTDLSIKLVGTDSGEMEYAVHDYSMDDGDVVSSNDYAEIKLEDGKTMVSPNANDTSAENVKLYVTKNDYVTAKVLEDGSEVKVDLADAELTVPDCTYNGKQQKPSVSVKVEGLDVNPSDYTVAYGVENINAGNGSVTITGKGNCTGTISKTFTIAKAANPTKIKAKGKTIKLKYLKLKKKDLAVSAGKYVSASNKQGALKYKVVSVKKAKFKKYFKINKNTGKIIVKKKLKKGTYTVKVKVAVGESTNYKASVGKTVSIKIRVK